MINWDQTLQYHITLRKKEMRKAIKLFLKEGNSFAVVDGVLYMSKASFQTLARGADK